MESTKKQATFGYEEFGAWYDAHSQTVLEPALARATEALHVELDDLLSDRDVARIRNIGGRIKSKHRTWRKLGQARYQDQAAGVDDIPRVIDDLIGLRVTCTNLRDLEMIQAALDSLPPTPQADRQLGLDPASERDYVDAPKDSGYRGWHVNLAVLVDGSPVTCELQIRTLLQDSWGELTHEDTYSKGGELPPLVEVLSKRMADLLATLDNIAEDLRTELDRIDEATVAEADRPTGAPAATTQVEGIGADAAEMLIDRWRSLDRPVELALLAWALQKEFGAEVSDDWFGHKTFKQFLRHAVPDGEISTGRQAYLLPANAPTPKATAASPNDSEASQHRTNDVGAARPDEARELRQFDRGLPLIEPATWRQIYEHLAEAWRRVGARKPSTQMINQMTRSARDRASALGEPLSRRHLDYVAKVVLATTEDGEPLPADEIANVFAAATVQRMTDLSILDADDSARQQAVVSWLAA